MTNVINILKAIAAAFLINTVAATISVVSYDLAVAGEVFPAILGGLMALAIFSMNTVLIPSLAYVNLYKVAAVVRGCARSLTPAVVVLVVFSAIMWALYGTILVVDTPTQAGLHAFATLSVWLPIIAAVGVLISDLKYEISKAHNRLLHIARIEIEASHTPVADLNERIQGWDYAWAPVQIARREECWKTSVFHTALYRGLPTHVAANKAASWDTYKEYECERDTLVEEALANRRVLQETLRIVDTMQARACGSLRQDVRVYVQHLYA